MSMEMYVLSSRRLRSMDEWQKTVDNLGFPIKFSEEVPFEQIDGFLPLLWRAIRTGFECNHWSIDDIREVVSENDVSPGFVHVLAFRWIGDFSELVAAVQAAAAYAVATDGMVFDCEERNMISAARAVEIARETESALPQAEAAMQKMLNELNSKK